MRTVVMDPLQKKILKLARRKCVVKIKYKNSDITVRGVIWRDSSTGNFHVGVTDKVVMSANLDVVEDIEYLGRNWEQVNGI